MEKEQTELHAMRHSLAHITAAAVQQLWPEAKFGVGPVIENGFYYDIDLGDQTISEDDFARIETTMRTIIAEDQPFERFTMPVEDAIEWAQQRKQPYKEELLNDLKRAGTTVARDLDANELGLAAMADESAVAEVSFYKNGNFTDLCRGPHVASTGKVGAFKLTKVAGAYWRGKEGNPQMQRLYGVAFATSEELDIYLQRMEEAKQYDHRRLGKELDLFVFSDMVGAGLPLFTPRGTKVRNLVKQALLDISKKYDVQEVTIPHIAKRELYETSGHAAKFSGELFTVQGHYGQEFVMKPVNCPHHIQLYAARPHSYKELPINFIETTMQYRDEKPGQIGGLSRVRAITVDDGHTFCTVGQIKEVAANYAKIIEEFYSSFGMYGQHWVSLSVRDPQTPDAYIGETEDWDKAESLLQQVSDELGLNAQRNEGEAALYGPKLDYMFRDLSGREIQLSTIQLDFAMPKRFDITYTDEDGAERHPVIVHRAIAGSYERFMVLLLESMKGWFPFWLAPEQVRILTINDTVADYVKEITTILDSTVLSKPVKYNEIRYSVDDRNESLGRKIKDASVFKVPAILVVGPKDAANGEVSIRLQNKEKKVPLNELVQVLQSI